MGAPVAFEKLAMNVMSKPAPRSQLALATPGDSEAQDSAFGVYVSQAAPKAPPARRPNPLGPVSTGTCNRKLQE